MKASFKTVLLLWVGCLTFTAQAATVTHLRCENRNNPLGLNTAEPRFSWQVLSDKNGDVQTAYQIRVTEGIAAQGRNDKALSGRTLWDSGKVKSNESILVPYQGKALASRSLAFWQVRVWDKDGKPSAWSEPALFSVGLLNAGDWTGDYIASPSETDATSPLLRQTFETDGKADKVFLHVNSLGYHEVYINGKKVGDQVLAPAVSQLDKRSLALTYDITPCLQAGKNEVMLWLGQGWYRPHIFGCISPGPVVRAQVELLKNKQWQTVLATDETWQASPSGRSSIGGWGYANFGGEQVDANATPVWTAARKIDLPAHTVSPQMVESNILAERWPAKDIRLVGDSVWVVDMGKCLTGWFEIRFPQLTKGQEIVLQYADYLEADGLPAKQGQCDRYIASGKSGESFRNQFNYHSYRFVRISNLKHKPALKDMTACLIRTGYEENSAFQCSDPEMNAIHDMVKHTLHCLSLGGYLVDCNHFERLGYGGDGHASTVTAQTMFNLNPLYANWLQAWTDVIRPDGGLPHTAPCPWSAGGGPYWCEFVATAPWSSYVRYGDRRLLETLYPVMRQWQKYIDAYTVDGLLSRWPDTDYRGWFLGDWAAPFGVQQSDLRSVDLVSNCVVVDYWATMEKIAGALGKADDAAFYARQKADWSARVQQRFFVPETNTYATASQIDMVYPMLAGITPKDLIPAVTQKLKDDTRTLWRGNLATGLVGIPVLTEWAVRQQETDFMYSMLKQHTYPGYLYMIDNGATATWEHWDGHRSRIHNCFNGIGSWFYQALGGIRPDENSPACRKVFIQPQVPKQGITWAKTTQATPYGLLTVNWEVQGQQVKVNVTVPVGCTAYLLPMNGVGEAAELSSGQHSCTIPFIH